MSIIDRRDFVKTASVALGAAAVVGAGSSTATAQGKPEKSAKLVYEVYALQYFDVYPLLLAKALYQTGWTDTLAVNFYIWAIKNNKNSEVTLVDTGVDAPTGQLFVNGSAAFKATLQKAFTTGPTFPKSTLVLPGDLVTRLGVKPEQVTKVVVSHMHVDHAAGMTAFPQLYPNAQFYVSKAEFKFWIDNPLAQRPPYKMFATAAGHKAMVDLLKTGRLTLVDGDQTIGPDMQALQIPGHTPATMGVMLPTAKGNTIVASDGAGHLFRGVKEDMPTGILSDIQPWLESFDKLRAMAPIENIFPGHDSLMATAFPKVADGITKLA